MTDQQQAPKMEATIKPNFDKKDIDENKLIACLSYVSILFLIPLILKKDSKFCQEHAKQGLVFFLAGLILACVSWVPVLGWMAGFFGGILLLVAAVVAIIRTWQGDFWEIPVIGMYRHKINL